jgi:hypothetical protein
MGVLAASALGAYLLSADDEKTTTDNSGSEDVASESGSTTSTTSEDSGEQDATDDQDMQMISEVKEAEPTAAEIEEARLDEQAKTTGCDRRDDAFSMCVQNWNAANATPTEVVEPGLSAN